MLTHDAMFVFGVLGVAIILFASSVIRPDVVALLIVLALILGDILPVGTALAGFGDPLVFLIAGLFVVGEGLVRTGIAYQAGQWLSRLAGGSEQRLLVLLMLAVAGLGAFMSSTGVVAIFIPVVLGVTSRLGISAGRLMMPLAFAALFSGMLTLIATPPNLVVNNALIGAHLQPFDFFSITPIGLVALALGVVYMWLVGGRLLPSAVPQDGSAGRRQTLAELANSYDLIEKLYRLRLDPNSPLVGKTVAELQVRTRYGISIVGMGRNERFAERLSPVRSASVFQAADTLYVVGSAADAQRLCKSEYLSQLLVTETEQRRLIKEMGLAEVMLPPASEMIGQTLREASFRTKYDVTVLGIRRKGKALPGNLIETRLAFGDILLISGAWKEISLLQGEQRNFLVLNLPKELDNVAPAYRQAPFALVILLLMVLSMAFGIVDNVAAVLLAALAMGVFRCLRMEDAYQSINWPTLVIIAGLLPLAQALQQTGGVKLVADGLVMGLGELGPLALMAGIFVLAALIGMFISNTATALLVAPIAIVAAQQIGVSPYPFAMTVAVAASAAFATPVSSPVNTLVLAPGGYSFGDFVRVGTPLLVLVMLITLLLVPLLLPF